MRIQLLIIDDVARTGLHYFDEDIEVVVESRILSLVFKRVVCFIDLALVIVDAASCDLELVNG